MSKYAIDFEPKGILKANPISIIGYYIISGLCVIGGIAIYFILLDSLMVLMLCIFGGAIFALISYFMSKTVYCWDDEHFAVIQPIIKPAVYRFDEIKQTIITYQSIALDIKNGKRYIIPCTYLGIEEFKAKLRETAE